MNRKSVTWSAPEESVAYAASHGGTERVSRRFLSAVARRDARDLVDAGYVDVLGDEGRTLKKAEAVEAINDDAAWANHMPDTPDYYEIGITHEGAEAFKAIQPQYRAVGLITKR